MKNLVFASLIAVTSIISFGVPAQAANPNIANAQYVYRHYGPRYYGPHHYHPYGRYCRVETVRHHRYGRWWVERVRVCR
jgi:hypothetical protein